MLKKSILTLALCTSLSFAAPSEAALYASESTYAVTEVMTEPGSENIEGDWTNSEEVNTVQTSEIARKMRQAEKAKNAAENDSFGGAITIIAMCIVLSALIILSVLFLGFGKISSAILSRKKKEAHGVSDDNLEDHHEAEDTGDAIAAIAMALAEHFGQTHDIEDTILTIRRMKKSYSPWNSKIYNLRNVPEVHHQMRH